MEKQFVTYEIALKLEELGYDDPCFKAYDEKGFLQDEDVMDALKLIKVLAPLWQQAIDWLRKRHNMWIIISKKNDHFENEIDFRIIPNRGDSIYNDEFKSFRKAREKAILKALSLLNKHN